MNLFIGIFASATTACTPIKILNSLVPKDGYSLKTDISFGNQTRQQLDIYIPKATSHKPLPVVVFLYGGGWESGEKSDYLFVGEAFSSKGFLTVVPNYRVFPEVTFPDLMEDPASAIAWTYKEIAKFGGDPNNIFVVGHSAGAHISMMLNLNNKYLGQENMRPDQIRSFIGIAGPYDFLPLRTERLKEIFGPERSWSNSQPINFVSGNNQPTLLLVGLKDATVWPSNTFSLANAITTKHGEVKVLEYPNYGHVEMIAKIAKPLRSNSNILDDIVKFINDHQN